MGISDSDGFPQIRHFLLWVFLTAFMDISDLRLNPSLPFMSTFLSNDYGFQPEIWHFLTCLEHLSNVAGIRHFRWWGSSVDFFILLCGPTRCGRSRKRHHGEEQQEKMQEAS